MSSHATTLDSSASPSLNVSRFRNIPYILIGLGLVGGLIGLFINPKQFAFSYLLAYVFFFSLCAGSLFLVLIHHLFDAAWSAPIRRFVEHQACLIFPTMGVLFIPVLALAPKLYNWMHIDPHTSHALYAKAALLNKPMWYALSIVVLVLLGFIAHRLRHWSLQQDKSGSAECTYKMRFYSFIGIFIFAFAVTLGIMLWVKSLEYNWFSTMFGVYYFAESVWTTLATVYVIMLVLKKSGPLAQVITNRQIHDVGVLWFAFTVFYAYIHFSQYFIIWNANIPEETFWYIKREGGTWFHLGVLIIFGHFFVPFLALLRIDAKMTPAVTVSLAIWAWLMHYCDVSYNITPVLHPKGFVLHPLDLACLAFIGGVLALVWIKYFKAHPPYPQKDPRMQEALGLHHPQASEHSVAKYEGTR